MMPSALVDAIERCRRRADAAPTADAADRIAAYAEHQRRAAVVSATEAMNALSGEGFARQITEMHLDNYEPETDAQRTALANARLVSHDPQRLGLLLTGKEGVGKTHLAVAIVGVAVRAGVGAAIVSVPEMLDTIRQSRESERLRLVAAYSRVPVLVLDDLGKESLNSATLEHLFRVVDARYRNRRRLVVTTNLRVESLEKRVSEDRTVAGAWSNIVGRVAAMTQGRWIEIGDGRGRLDRVREERATLAQEQSKRPVAASRFTRTIGAEAR